MKETHKSMENYLRSFLRSFKYFFSLLHLSTYIQLKLFVEPSLSLNYPKYSPPSMGRIFSPNLAPKAYVSILKTSGFKMIPGKGSF